MQGAAELDTPKVLAAGSQLSLWFKAHMPDILTAAPQGHSLVLLVLPRLCASDHAWQPANRLGVVVPCHQGFAAQLNATSDVICQCMDTQDLTAHLKAVQASALLAYIGQGAEGSPSNGDLFAVLEDVLSGQSNSAAGQALCMACPRVLTCPGHTSVTCLTV